MGETVAALHQQRREFTAKRLEDAIEFMKYRNIDDPILNLLVSLCDNASWLLRDWPNQETDDSTRQSRLSSQQKLQLVLHSKPTKKSESDSLIVLLSDAFLVISEQWMGGGAEEKPILAAAAKETPLPMSDMDVEPTTSRSCAIAEPVPLFSLAADSPQIVKLEPEEAESSGFFRPLNEELVLPDSATSDPIDQNAFMGGYQMPSTVHFKLQSQARDMISDMSDLFRADAALLNGEQQPSTSFSTQEMAGRHSSVWTYYERLMTEGSVACRLCGKTANFSGKTSNLWRHLRLIHPQHYEAERALEGAGERKKRDCEFCEWKGTTNLKRHLKAHHPEEFARREKKKEEEGRNSDGMEKNDQTMGTPDQ